MKHAVHMRRAALVLTAALLTACGGEPGCWTTDTPGQLANRPSPLDSTLVTLGEGTAKVCYGRPSARGREVMGGLVPYGQIWRFGANEATTVHLPFPARIGEVQVEPGSYTLYAVPGEDAWTITVNGALERWGIPVDEAVAAQDLGSFTVPVEMLDDPVETFTMTFQATGADSAELLAEWERARIRIPVQRLEG